MSIHKLFISFLIPITLLLSSNVSLAMEERDPSSSLHNRYRAKPQPQRRYQSVENLTDKQYKAMPHSYPLFTIEYSENEYPVLTHCSVSDFERSCGYNATCKTRKGICGENLSTNFFDQNMPWKKLEGKYDSARGFDGFYKVVDSSVKFIVVEDKAGDTAHLDSKTRQMSLFWEHNTATTVNESGNLDYSDYVHFNTALLQGEVVSLFTRTLYKDNRTPTRDRNSLDLTSLSENLPSFFATADSYSYSTTTNSYSYADNFDNVKTQYTRTSRYEESRPRYTFRTEVSLLGAAEWPSQFKTAYINNYQQDIHPLFDAAFSRIGCPLTTGGYCLSRNDVELKNFGILSTSAADQITFGSH